MRDLDLVKERLVNWITRMMKVGLVYHPGEPGPTSAGEYLASQQPDGSWLDLQYAEADRHTWGRAIRHTTRLLEMACIYHDQRARQEADERLLAGIRRGLGFWTDNDFLTSGWWANTIFIPRELGRTMLVMEPELSEEEIAAGCEVMRRSWPGPWSARTGQNLVWHADVTVLRGCLENSRLLTREALDGVASALVITDREGIQPDLSFHQHGPQLYSGGYGWDFMHDCARLVWAARETSFAFSGAEVDMLSRYVLDGIAWILRGRTLDFSAMGRELARPYVPRKYERLLNACQLLAEANVPRRAEFQALAENLTQNHVTAGPIGHRHFWRSDFMVHRRKGYHLSVRMSSVRTFGIEELRGENKQNAYQADGVMCLLRTGSEYAGILPVWNWRRLPGITCRQAEGPVAPVRMHEDADRRTRFVGGLSDGTYGFAALDYRRDELSLRARKAWFCFDDEVVCLGAGISGTGEGAVLTTVNQCLRHGPVTAKTEAGGRELPTGDHTLQSAHWVHHDGIGYVFLEPAAFSVACRTQTASWQDVHHGGGEVCKDVFSIWVDHGNAAAGARYAYVIMPGMEPDRLDEYRADLPVKVVANDPDLQAVHHAGLKLTQMAFYKPGRVEAAGVPSVAVARSALVMLRPTDDGYILSICNPENEPAEMAVELGEKLDGLNCSWDERRGVTRLQLELPGGLCAGSTVTCPLTCSVAAEPSRNGSA